MVPEAEGRERIEGLPSAAAFERRLVGLVLFAWLASAPVGFSFLLYIQMFTWEEVRTILVTPLEPLFVILSTAIAWYFTLRSVAPVVAYLRDPSTEREPAFLESMRRFSFRFWALFLGYILLAPSSVILSAHYYSGFTPEPLDWFRIHLVALIVSILVGLPVYVRILDLFGSLLGGVRLERIQVSIKVKVFLVGTLMPLLIDSMLVQYYWAKTGYFTWETLIVWLLLEVIAIVGALVFVRSFAQGLAPMQRALVEGAEPGAVPLDVLRPASTDEVGVLVSGFQKVLRELEVRNEILDLNNRLLRSASSAGSLSDALDRVILLCSEMGFGDLNFLILQPPGEEMLIGVAQTGMPYRREGYYTLSLEENSLAVRVFREQRPVAIDDVAADPRASRRMVERFGIRAAIAAPLITGGRVMGVLLCADTRTTRHYSRREIQLLEALAQEAAVVLHTASLEEEMRSARAWVVDLLNASAEGVCGVDRSGNCTFVNPAALKMLGYAKAAELLGSNLHEKIHHSYADGSPFPRENCPIRRTLEEGIESHSTDEVHWRADGSSFPVEYWARPVIRDGKVAGAVITFVDISERLAAERALRESEQRWRTLVSHLPDQVLLLDAEGWILYANRLDGVLQPPDAVGLSVDRIIPEDQRGRFHRLLQEVAASGVAGEIQLRVDSDEGEKWWSYRVAPLRGEEGLEGFIVLSSNISELKRAEQVLRHDREELERTVAERTAELRAAYGELESFIYSVSHDLRAPLRAISGFGEALEEDCADRLDEEGRDYLRRIRAAAARMGDLIEALLQLSRLTREELVRRDVDLSAIARQVLERLSAEEPDRQVTWHVEEGLRVHGDRRLLTIMMENLLGNAWKFTSRRAHARIEVGSEESDGRRLFFVHDTGAGFDMKYADRLFGAFQRLHSAEEFEGTGIGLATVQRIVQLHGGSITAEGEEGSHATFRFELPPAEADPAAESAE